MALRCLTGHIGYGGVIYATGDVFDVDDDEVAKSLIDGDNAEAVKTPDAVEEVADPVVIDEPKVVAKEPKTTKQKVAVEEPKTTEPEKPKRGRKR